MSQSLSRRSFLKYAGSGAVSLAAALLTGVSGAALAPCYEGEPALLDGKAAVELLGYAPAPGLGQSLIHISEPTRPERISYAVFCLKKKDIRKFTNMFKLRKHQKKVEAYKEEYLEEYYTNQRIMKQKNAERNKREIFKIAA